MKKLVLLLAVVFSVGFGGSVLFSSCGNDSSSDSTGAGEATEEPAATPETPAAPVVDTPAPDSAE